MLGKLFPKTKSPMEIAQSITTETIMAVTLSNVSNCSSTGAVNQRLVISSKDSAALNIGKVRMNAELSSSIKCLMTTKLTVQDIAKIKSELTAKLDRSSIKFPDLNREQKGMNAKQEWITRVTTQVDIASAVNSVQENAANQDTLVEATDSSTLNITDFEMNVTMKVFNEVINDQVSTVAREFEQEVLGDSELKSKEVNALQPFADVINNTVDELAGVINKGVGGATKVASTALIMWGIVAIIVLIVGAYVIKTVGVGNLMKLTPTGRALSMISGPSNPPQDSSQPPSNEMYQQPPNNSYQPPNNSYQPPNNSYQPPNNSYQPPNNSYQPPNNSYQPPNNSYQPPNNGYQQNNNPQPSPDASNMLMPPQQQLYATSITVTPNTNYTPVQQTMMPIQQTTPTISPNTSVLRYPTQYAVPPLNTSSVAALAQSDLAKQLANGAMNSLSSRSPGGAQLVNAARLLSSTRR